MTDSTYFKARRTELGLTQRGIAERLGISTQAVSSWEDEKNPSTPRPQLWDALAEVLNVPAEHIACEVLKAAREDRQQSVA